jgi:AbrB family looped-hinge helix DNA binding protein
MSAFTTTRLSSRGQLVIPESVRRQLGLKTGMEFVVVGDKDILVLKVLTPPDLNRFSRQIQRARFQARKAALRRAARLAGSRKRRRK